MKVCKETPDFFKIRQKISGTLHEDLICFIVADGI